MARREAAQPVPEQREWRTTGRVAFGLLALVLVAATYQILKPFLSAIVLAAILVVLTYPTYDRVTRAMRGRRGLAALVMLLGVTVLLVLPAFLIGVLLVGQAKSLIDSLQSGEARAMLSQIDLAERLSFLTRRIPGLDPTTLRPDQWVLPVLREIPGWVGRHGQALLGGLAGLVVGLLLTMLAAFYLYLDGKALVSELSALSPLPARYGGEIAGRFEAVVDATFRGQMVTSLAQGVAVAIGLAIAQVPGALLWGSVAAVLSLLPMVGAAVVWIPATIYLGIAASMGHRGWGWAIFLTVWGVLVVSTIDNVVRPWVMRGRAELPAIPLLFAVLGGLQAFGFVGLVVGPLVFSLLKSVIDIYEESFQRPAAEQEAIAVAAREERSEASDGAAAETRPVPATGRARKKRKR
jgi:predicted PurR-regulated permease PerM